jgi:hypothetical protein
VKILVATALLLALASPGHAETCTGRVKIITETVGDGLYPKGDKIFYVGDCVFGDPAPVLRKCPVGSRCLVEGDHGPDGITENVTIVIRLPATPYKEGMRDYREGLCYRARPYVDHSPEQKLWERGYEAARVKDRNKRDWTHCHPWNIKEKH